MALLMAERVDRPPLTLFGEPAGDGGLGGGPTLDDRIVGVWEGLTAQVVVCCLLCDGALRPWQGDDAHAAGGHCDRCGTTLI